MDLTWKQGEWNSGGRCVKFQRPPKLPIRAPKRQKFTRQFFKPHKSKRARLVSEIYSSNFIVDSDMENHDHRDERNHTDHLQTFRWRHDEMDKADFVIKPNDSHKRKHVDEAEISHCWPQDWIPADCPNARVIAVNYNTDPYLWRPIWVKPTKRSDLCNRAREMSDMLTSVGVGQNRPIIWVGHSKGGLYIKQIIVDAWESGLSIRRPLWASSRGVLFYSVPHRGSSLAVLNLPFLEQSVEMAEIRKSESRFV